MFSSADLLSYRTESGDLAFFYQVGRTDDDQHRALYRSAPTKLTHKEGIAQPRVSAIMTNGSNHEGENVLAAKDLIGPLVLSFGRSFPGDIAIVV